MPIAYRCPSCQKKFDLGDNLAGKSFTCWECGGVGDVPYVRPAPSKRIVDDPEDDDEIEKRPRRRKFKKNNTSNAGLVVVIIGVCVLVLMGIVAAIVYLIVQASASKSDRPTIINAPPPATAGNRPNIFTPAPKAPEESPESKIAKTYSFTREKINLGTPGRGLGLGTQIPYTMQIEPDPDPLANMPQPRFGPKIVRPARYSPGFVMTVMLVEGQFKESMIAGGFFWEKDGALEFRTMFGQLPANTPFFLAVGKERISNVIYLPGGP